MGDDRDPFEKFSSETLRRAEQMCSGLESGLSLDRRGRSVLFHGAVADLDKRASDHVSVTVAEVDHDPGFTLILDHPIGACKKALLVFRRPPGKDVRYVGSHKASEPGKRGDADQDRHVTHFTIEKQL